MNAPLIHLLLADGCPWRDRGGRGVDSARRARRLADAIATMVRGTAFLHARAAVIEARGASSVSRHAMVLANALRELDCFLVVLLDELAASAGLRGTALTAFRRRRNAEHKLAAYPALFGGSADDLGILRTFAKQKAVLLALFRGRRTTAGSILVAAKFATIDLKTISNYYADLSARIIVHAEQARGERALAA